MYIQLSLCIYPLSSTAFTDILVFFWFLFFSVYSYWSWRSPCVECQGTVLYFFSGIHIPVVFLPSLQFSFKSSDSPVLWQDSPSPDYKKDLSAWSTIWLEVLATSLVFLVATANQFVQQCCLSSLFSCWVPRNNNRLLGGWSIAGIFLVTSSLSLYTCRQIIPWIHIWLFSAVMKTVISASMFLLHRMVFMEIPEKRMLSCLSCYHCLFSLLKSHWVWNFSRELL